MNENRNDPPNLDRMLKVVLEKPGPPSDPPLYMYLETVSKFDVALRVEGSEPCAESLLVINLETGRVWLKPMVSACHGFPLDKKGRLLLYEESDLRRRVDEAVEVLKTVDIKVDRIGLAKCLREAEEAAG